MAQQSARVLTANSETLYAFAGRRSDTNAGSFRMELWAGGSVANGAVIGGTLLSSVDFDHTLLAPNSFIGIQTLVRGCDTLQRLRLAVKRCRSPRLTAIPFNEAGNTSPKRERVNACCGKSSLAGATGLYSLNGIAFNGKP